jgi:hypothetical protein
MKLRRWWVLGLMLLALGCGHRPSLPSPDQEAPLPELTVRLLSFQVCQGHEVGYWAVYSAQVREIHYYMLFLVSKDNLASEEDLICRVEWNQRIAAFDPSLVFRFTF